MSNQYTILDRSTPYLAECGITTFGSYSLKTPRGVLTKHDHQSSYEICFLETGMQPYYIYPTKESSDSEAKLYRLYGGELFITRPYEIHATGPFQQLRGRLCWIQIDSEAETLLMHTPESSALLRKALGTLNQHILRIPRSVSDRLTEAYRLILVPNRVRLFRACELLSLFIMELADFNRRITEEPCRYGILSSKGLEAVTFIHDNLLSPNLNVDMVAAHLHYSRSYAMAEFKKEIGLTIHEFILRSKIDYACELLANHTVTETAQLLNFASSQHFSKVFKDYTALTPSEYCAGLNPNHGTAIPSN